MLEVDTKENHDSFGGDPLTEPPWIRALLLTLALLFLTLFLILPLILLFYYALRGGLAAYIASITDPDALSAIRLTLLVAIIVVPINTLFGVCAAWAVAKFRYSGKSVLVTLMDLPFAISPVIAGLIFILLFGARGWFGPWLSQYDFQIIFAVPGIVLVTLFVTLPFVARELIPLMQEQGTDAEETALTLGAGGIQTFWRVTLPSIKWALIYGVLLCNARAMGEFGAVSVVSGHIRGRTNTMPLHIEILYNDYQLTSSFAVASLLTMLALLTLIVKATMEGRQTSSILATSDKGVEKPK